MKQISTLYKNELILLLTQLASRTEELRYKANDYFFEKSTEIYGRNVPFPLISGDFHLSDEHYETS